MLIATAKNRKGGKREGRGEFFSNLFISPPPSDEELRVGAGLGAEEEKTLTTRQRCLEDLPSDIVPRKWAFTKSKNPWYSKCGQNYICAGLAWLARLAEKKEKKHI